MDFKQKLLINEMAKSAQMRIFDRLPKERKFVYVLGYFIENNTVSLVQRPVLKAFIENYNIDWNEFCDFFEINPDMGQPFGYNEIVRKFNDSNYKRQYDHMKRTINVNKDEVDTKYIDTLLDYYKSIRTHSMEPDEAYTQYDMDTVLAWVKENTEEVKERLGNKYNTIMAILERWLDPTWAGSDRETISRWFDYARKVAAVRREHGDPNSVEMPDDLLYKLAIIVQLPNASEICHDTPQKNYSGWITSVIKQKFPNNELPTISSCRAHLGEEVDPQDLPPKERFKLITDSITDEDLPVSCFDDIKTYLNEIFSNWTDHTEDINEEAIGKVDKEVVKTAYRKAKTELNRLYHVGTDAPFNESNLQEFYDKYKKLFTLGLTISGIIQILDIIGKDIKTKLEARADSLWDDVNDDDELTEAIKLITKLGYNIY
ncbi:MAG: hypothetical protein HUJ61_03045 [Bacilli bacterium]|nr:hypothetical protein [Bacilli bacterium]